MPNEHIFPFGQRMQQVVQVDRTPKKVFVLGVYASAVHARWLDAGGQTVVQALAVASEPYIFWRGEGAAEIIAGIPVPPAAGSLTVPANADLNGPAGRALDRLFLEPLGCSRADAWLCDLVPHACLNREQQQAVAEHYEPMARQHGLPPVTIPPVPGSFTNAARRREIAEEIAAAQPRLIILLGDQPIRWFLSDYRPERRLGEFGDRPPVYGRVHEYQMLGQTYRILPLAHPRQAAALGTHSTTWRKLHRIWMGRRAFDIRQQYLEV